LGEVEGRVKEESVQRFGLDHSRGKVGLLLDEVEKEK